MSHLNISKGMTKFTQVKKRLLAQPDHIDFKPNYGRTQWPPEQLLPALKTVHRLFIAGEPVSLTTLQDLESGYGIADAPADGLIQNKHYFAKALIDHAQQQKPLPDFLQNHALTEQFMQQPAWFDQKLANIGATAYQRYPLLLIWMLRNVSLMAGYSIPALSLPLVKTGALVHDALPRLLRTYEFILAVSKPDSLKVGHSGWAQCVWVRQIHANVRAQLCAGLKNSSEASTPNTQPEKSSWDTAHWGLPINQTDMVATHLQFSLLIMRGFKTFGARLSAEESLGILHLWQLASYWLGVDINRLPNTEEASWPWLYSYICSQTLDFDVGKPLAMALHDLPRQLAGKESKAAQITENINASITRLLAGKTISDGLGLPNPKYKYALLTIPPAIHTFDLITEKTPIRHKMEAIAQMRQQRILDFMRQFVK